VLVCSLSLLIAAALWCCGAEDLVYGGQLVNEEMIFSNCGSIVFVIDAQDEPYAEALARLHDTVTRAHRYNPDILFEVFIHKVDGDLFLSDDHKIGTARPPRLVRPQRRSLLTV
jgi:hypothetical protein